MQRTHLHSRPGESAARRGFTLLELLTIMSVIAILVAVLMPGFGRVRAQARQAVCLAHLRQVAAACQLYLQDWDERFPHWYFPLPPPGEDGLYPFVAWPPRPAGSERRYGWTTFLRPYLRESQLVRESHGSWEGQPGIGEWLGDYVLPTWGPGGEGTYQDPYWRWPGPAITVAQVRRPSETIQCMDGVSTTHLAWGEGGRHLGGANVAFVDGHARWLAHEGVNQVDGDDHGSYWLRYAAVDR